MKVKVINNTKTETILHVDILKNRGAACLNIATKTKWPDFSRSTTLDQSYPQKMCLDWDFYGEKKYDDQGNSIVKIVDGPVTTVRLIPETIADKNLLDGWNGLDSERYGPSYVFMRFPKSWKTEYLYEKRRRKPKKVAGP